MLPKFQHFKARCALNSHVNHRAFCFLNEISPYALDLKWVLSFFRQNKLSFSPLKAEASPLAVKNQSLNKNQSRTRMINLKKAAGLCVYQYTHHLSHLTTKTPDSDSLTFCKCWWPSWCLRGSIVQNVHFLSICCIPTHLKSNFPSQTPILKSMEELPALCLSLSSSYQTRVLVEYLQTASNYNIIKQHTFELQHCLSYTDKL